jgi:branched-chain amino acid transport system permease protein
MRALIKAVEKAIDGSIGRHKLGLGLMALVVLFFLLFPQDASQSNYAKTVFIFGFFYAILSSSWALLAGISGQFSFGHMGFLGIGAYTAGLLGRYGLSLSLVGVEIPPESVSSIGAIIVGTLAAGFVGLIIGWLLLRLRSSYLALFTIAFSELFRLVVLTEYDYTGGSNGIKLQPIIELGDVIAERQIEYYIMFGLLLASLALMYMIANSRIGLFLRAMREDEDAASSLGVNVVFYKVLIFVVTSMIIGLAGTVFYSNVGSERIVPDQLEVLGTSLIIAYAVLGGMESLLGSATGAFIALYALEQLRQITIALPFGLTFADGSTYQTFDTSFWRYAIFGVAMVLTLRYMRNGLLYPILQWFQGRDIAMMETVSIRQADETEPELPTETEVPS